MIKSYFADCLQWICFIFSDVEMQKMHLSYAKHPLSRVEATSIERLVKYKNELYKFHNPTVWKLEKIRPEGPRMGQVGLEWVKGVPEWVTQGQKGT